MTGPNDAAGAIDERSRLFEKAYAAGDAAMLVDGYFAPDADNPTAYPPGGNAPIKGRVALKDMFAAMFVGVPRIRLQREDLICSKTVATEIGRAFLTIADGTIVIGRYTVGWIFTDEGWRAKADFFAEDGWED